MIFMDSQSCDELLSITLHHTILSFNDPKLKSLLKTLWKEEKMLVTSIFPFPTMLSTLNKTNFYHCCVKMLSIWSSLKFCRKRVNRSKRCNIPPLAWEWPNIKI